MTVLVERVPWRLRSQRDLRRRFDELCGSGAVHSCHVVIAGLGDLERLVAARDRAQDNLEDALSKRAMRVAFRRQDATKKLGDDDETWRGDTPARGPGRSRGADGGAEATGAAVTYRVKSDFCPPTLFTRLFLITRPEDMHVSHPLVGPHTPQLTAVKTKAAKLLAVRRGDNLHNGRICAYIIG